MYEGHTHIISETNESNFDESALEVFKFQYQRNNVYHTFCDLLGKTPQNISAVEEIPFLPISSFKNHDIIVSEMEPEAIFSSSSTTGTGQSLHPVASLQLYEDSFVKGFERSYGPISNYCILALLPSYLDRQGSSLVYMASKLIEKSNNNESGFYIDDFQKLSETIEKCEANKQPTILLGVTFALMDFAERFPKKLAHTLIMETGGMKGRQIEMQKAELHQYLGKQFGVDNIHSEYGMTEMLSQAYSKGDGIFTTPPWMKILIRSVDDPIQILSNEKWGGINVIDLANIYSCSFLATDDIGKIHLDGTFETAGRLDNSDVRGCSLLYI
ncbi:MAG: acyl transferase [Bacteroidota bacterium]|nr:acyl transferase [Bacteroidota bacterium]